MKRLNSVDNKIRQTMGMMGWKTYLLSATVAFGLVWAGKSYELDKISQEYSPYPYEDEITERNIFSDTLESLSVQLDSAALLAATGQEATAGEGQYTGRDGLTHKTFEFRTPGVVLMLDRSTIKRDNGVWEVSPAHIYGTVSPGDVTVSLKTGFQSCIRLLSALNPLWLPRVPGLLVGMSVQHNGVNNLPSSPPVEVYWGNSPWREPLRNNDAYNACQGSTEKEHNYEGNSIVSFRFKREVGPLRIEGGAAY